MCVLLSGVVLNTTLNRQENIAAKYLNLGKSPGIALMLFCDEVWVFGDVISEGMGLEIEYANSRGKVVKYYGTGRDS